jgi:transposase
MRRGGHLFVADYGMQLNILNRYGIKNFAVPGKDYLFINNDNTDYRYQNIKIINRYNGVTKENKNTTQDYVAKIHINGDYIIGRYKSDIEAAIAYNKAIDILHEIGVNINYQKNYIESLDTKEYLELYEQTKISKKLRALVP